jgi:hypothetical protein
MVVNIYRGSGFTIFVAVVDADLVIGPFHILLQLKHKYGWTFKSIALILMREGNKDLLANGDITLLGDHQHDVASGDAFHQVHILVHPNGIDRRWRTTQVHICIIQSHIRAPGLGDHPESAIHGVFSCKAKYQ